MNLQRCARIIGVLLLLSIVGGGFGEAYVPLKLIVRGDPIATANNVHAHDFLFRLGFAAYLLEAVCDVGLALYFYLLLRTVQEDLALLSAFFGLVSTSVFAVGELFFFAFPIAKDPMLLKLYSLAGSAFMVFYGLTTLLRGLLIFRSRFLPKFLGVLMMIAGLGFIAGNAAVVLAPAYKSDLFALPMFVAVLTLTAWMLTKGVDVARTA